MNDEKIIEDICKILKNNIYVSFGIESMLKELKKDSFYIVLDDKNIRKKIKDIAKKLPEGYIYYTEGGRNFLIYRDQNELKNIENLKNKWFKIYFDHILNEKTADEALELLRNDIVNDEIFINSCDENYVYHIMEELLIEISNEEKIKERLVKLEWFSSLTEPQKINLITSSGFIEHLETKTVEEHQFWQHFLLTNLSSRVDSILIHVKNLIEPVREQNFTFLLWSMKLLAPILTVVYLFFFEFDISPYYTFIMLSLVLIYFLFYLFKGQFFLRLFSLFALYQLLKNIPLTNNFISFFDDQISNSYVIPDFNIFYISLFVSHFLLSSNMFHIIWMYKIIILPIEKVLKTYIYFFIKNKMTPLLKLKRIEMKFLARQYNTVVMYDNNKIENISKFSQSWTKFINRLFNVDIKGNIDDLEKPVINIVNFVIYFTVVMMITFFVQSFNYSNFKDNVRNQYLILNSDYCRNFSSNQLMIKLNSGNVLLPLTNMEDKKIEIPKEYKDYKYMSYPCDHVTLIK